MMNVREKACWVCLFWIAGVAATGIAQGTAIPAQVRQTVLSIPTYRLGSEDPNPPFALVNSRDVYPYTMLDDLTDHREAVAYKAIILENEYLRATILPDLGGRLYSLYDKKAAREVFYRNRVVKYGLVGLRGAWISGGIEFNFPNGHTTDTVSPVASWYQENPDGSATVWVGDIDQVSEMYWEVALTLRPGDGKLTQRITLFNPSPLEGLYWYWNNAAVPATADMQFFYPMREVTPNSRTETWTYPQWKGVDYSRYRDIRTPTEIFATQVRRDYFGVYYRGTNFGVVHVADHHAVPGKKLWTWGVAGDGAIWTRLLTDDDGPYNEIQSGRFETQLNREFLAPQRVESWTEYWYPVQGLGDGFVEASKQLALNVQFLTGERGKGEIRIYVSPTESIREATLTVSVDGKKIDTLNKLSFEPLTARVFSIPFGDIEAARAKAAVEITGAGGASLVHWSAAEPVDGNLDFVSKIGTPSARDGQDVQDLFLQGLRAEKEGRDSDAERLFQSTLATDPNYIPALRKLAVQSFRAADYALAEKYTVRALQRDDSDPETLYLSGIVERALDHLSAAEDALWSSLRMGISPPRALVQLGEIALARRDYARAEEILRRGLLRSPDNALLHSALAAALRLDNKLPQAGGAAAEAVSVAPLYPIARAEAWRVAAAQGTASRKLSSRQAWEQAAGDRLQSYLEAASWYWNIKDWASSDFVLKAALVRRPSGNISPMVYYYLASNARHQGLASRAEEYATKAHAVSYAGVFPNRLQDVSVLQEAIAVNPADSLAKYLLGNFLFQYGRYAQAAALWRSAEGAGFHDAVLYRNLGIDAWRVNHNLDEGAAWFRKALDQAPHDYRLYVDLDDIYAQQGTGQMEERERLFKNAPADVLDHDSSRLRYALLLIEEGQFDKALTLLANHSFEPWEQGEDPRSVFVLANLEKGRLALSVNDFKRAQESFERALEYPSNLGIGRPDKGDDGAVLYWLGVALHRQRDTQGAERAWNSVLDGGGGGDLSRYYAALALKADGHSEEAVERLRKLADGPLAGRTRATNYYVAGLAELELQHAARAREDFRKALEVNPLLWQAQIEMHRMRGSGTEISHP